MSHSPQMAFEGGVPGPTLQRFASVICQKLPICDLPRRLAGQLQVSGSAFQVGWSSLKPETWTLKRYLRHGHRLFPPLPHGDRSGPSRCCRSRAPPPEYRLTRVGRSAAGSACRHEISLLPLGDGRQCISVAQHARGLPPADDRDRAAERLRAAGDMAAGILAGRRRGGRSRAARFRAWPKKKWGPFRTSASRRSIAAWAWAPLLLWHSLAGFQGGGHRAGLSGSHGPETAAPAGSMSGSAFGERRSSIRPLRLRTRKRSGRKHSQCRVHQFDQIPK